MNDDPDIKLRDQLAISVIQALLTSKHQYSYLNHNGTITGTIGAGHSNASVSLSANEFVSEMSKDYINRLEKDLELFTDFAYRVADQMRKSRIKTFT